MFIKSSRLVKSSLLALFILASGIFFSHSVYAGTSISISNSSNNISFTSVKPSASGSVTTATDTIDITTDCSAGSNVYISAVDGSSYGTNLVNNAAASNNTISTLSGTTIGTTALSLENNTWGFNTDSTAASNGNYYGLPAYTNATDHAIYSGTNTTVPIYYGAKVTNALVPGKYIGQVLYTATVNSSCLNYTVIFNKNANDATGTMNNQTMTPAASTALTSNGFTRPGYIFLGWSTDQNATTPTYTDGQAVIDITTPGGTITLHAIWKNIYFQEDNACSTIPAGNNNGGILKDSRDNQEYRVYRWPSTGTAGTDYPTNMAGFCIMTQDLSLGYTTGGSVTRGGNLTLTTDDSAGAGTINGSWTDDSNIAYYNNGPLSGSEAYTNHSYYNATASLIVCPKGWRLPTTTEYNNFRNFLGGSNANSVSKAKSSPYNFVLGGDYLAAGYSFVNSFGSYYTASKGSYFHIEAEAMNVGSYTNSYGRSVRCISDPADGYMQDYDTSTITTNQTVILRDARDGNSYTIKRLEDGKVWMVQNLRLTKVKLTPDDSNVSSTFDLTSLNQSGQNWCSDNNTDCYNKKSIYYNESSRYSYGAIYNYYTATAGTGSSITTGNAPSDICPKGWRLPTVEDFINLDKAWGGNGENRNDANTYNIFAGPYTNGNNGGFDLTGFIYIQLYEVGTKGRFLSSTAVNSSSRYQLDIIPATNTVNPVAGDRRDVGGAIRCVSKITNAKVLCRTLTLVMLSQTLATQ
ncbi:InlB B-repeat-containing protein [Candidatus Saccharibacteria bacterium]|nr:InlB B-repeat-containing protein [Candidatus Saccharibacteria bacterium]